MQIWIYEGDKWIFDKVEIAMCGEVYPLDRTALKVARAIVNHVRERALADPTHLNFNYMHPLDRVEDPKVPKNLKVDQIPAYFSPKAAMSQEISMVGLWAYAVRFDDPEAFAEIPEMTFEEMLEAATAWELDPETHRYRPGQRARYRL